MASQFRYALIQEGEFENWDNIPEDRWSFEYPKVYKTLVRDKFGRLPVQTIVGQDREVGEWSSTRVMDSTGGDYLPGQDPDE